MNPQTKHVVHSIFGAVGETLSRIGSKAQDAALEAGTDEVEKLADKVADGARQVAQKLRARKRRLDEGQ